MNKKDKEIIDKIDEFIEEFERLNVDKVCAKIAEIKKLKDELGKGECEEDCENGCEDKWIPGDNEKYWTISTLHENIITRLINENDRVDKTIFNSGLYFKTEKEAKDFVNKMIVLRKMEKYDCDGNGKKYYMYYNKYLQIESWESWVASEETRYGIIEFKSKEDIMKCISEIGMVGLVKYYFGNKECIGNCSKCDKCCTVNI